MPCLNTSIYKQYMYESCRSNSIPEVLENIPVWLYQKENTEKRCQTVQLTLSDHRHVPYLSKHKELPNNLSPMLYPSFFIFWSFGPQLYNLKFVLYTNKEIIKFQYPNIFTNKYQFDFYRSAHFFDRIHLI